MIKASLKPSRIDGGGIGLFADQDVPKGTLVWKYNPLFDIHFNLKTVQNMSEIEQNFIKEYAFLSQDSGKYTLSIDNARFWNHSSVHDNLEDVADSGDIEAPTIAKRDIKAGEELLINYRTIDTADMNSDAPYLNS